MNAMPEAIRITPVADLPWLTAGRVYTVLRWTANGYPLVRDDEGDAYSIPRPAYWEAVLPTVADAPEPSGSVAHSILTEAAGIVQGARNATHGDKERSFGVIADLWNAYLAGRKTGGPITPRDVAAFMVLLKLARSVQGDPVRDHFVDAAGYAAIAGELA